MKKIFLSLFTILSFSFYVIFFGKSDAFVSVEPKQVAVAKKPTTTPRPSPAPTPVPTPIDTSPTPTPVNPTPTPPPYVPPPKPKGIYQDGTYTGNSADAYYGYIQVEAVISNGKLSDVLFLDHPQDRGTSIRINDYAMPILRSEAIKAQSAQVSTVSGASDSSAAFRESLADALSQAKI